MCSRAAPQAIGFARGSYAPATVMRAASAALPGYGRRHPIRKHGRNTSRAYNRQVPHRARHARPSLPASIVALRHDARRIFLSDLVAGVTVGLVALPLAMAFAISSGMTPQAGIYTAIASGFLISALGGSYVQIGGPTGAFVVVVSGIIAAHGIDGLFMCTMMAGVLLVAMGLTGTGTAVRFIPRPVVIGFTNGIALVIASTQLKDFLGLALPQPTPSEFIPRMARIAEHLDAISIE